MREHDYSFPIKPGMISWVDQSDEYKENFYKYQKGWLAKEEILNQSRPKTQKIRKRWNKDGRVEITI